MNLDAVALGVGYCTSDVAKAKAAGFDFAEIPIRPFAQMSDAEFEAFAAQQKAAGLPTLAGYMFLPGDLKIVGPAVDRPRALAHAKTVFARCERLGVKTIVFGAPASRTAPEGFSKEEAFAQLVAFGKETAPEAAKYGVTLGAEPIRSAETNMINTTPEGLAWVDAVGHPNFRFMVDLFHMVGEKEDLAVLAKAKGQLVYVKVGNPKGRTFPLSAAEYDYAAFFRALRSAGYDGPIGMETTTTDVEGEAPKSIAFLKAAWREGSRRR